jgi:hypothetical protein
MVKDFKPNCFFETWLSSLPFLEGFYHSDCQCDSSLAKLSFHDMVGKMSRVLCTSTKVREDLSRKYTNYRPFAIHLAVLIELNLLSLFSYTLDSLLAEISSVERYLQFENDTVLFRSRYQRLIDDAIIGEVTEKSRIWKAFVFRESLLRLTTEILGLGRLSFVKSSLVRYHQKYILFHILFTHSLACYCRFWWSQKVDLDELGTAEIFSWINEWMAEEYFMCLCIRGSNLRYEVLCLIADTVKVTAI